MLINIQKLENLLKSNWTEFINYKELIDQVKKTIKENNFDIIFQTENFKNKFEIIVTKINFEKKLDIWVEYTAPKEGGVVIGTIVYSLSENDLKIKEIHGTHIKPLQES